MLLLINYKNLINKIYLINIIKLKVFVKPFFDAKRQLFSARIDWALNFWSLFACCAKLPANKDSLTAGLRSSGQLLGNGL